MTRTDLAPILRETDRHSAGCLFDDTITARATTPPASISPSRRRRRAGPACDQRSFPMPALIHASDSR